jgi:uncharacterized cofD-like protein
VDAIKATRKQRVYVANLMTQPGETDDYALSDHIRALERHVGPGFMDVVVAHEGSVPDGAIRNYREIGAEPVACDLREHDDLDGVRLITGDFYATDHAEFEWDETASTNPDKPAGAVRHDSAALACVIFEQFFLRLGSPDGGSSGESSGDKITAEAHGTRALG